MQAADNGGAYAIRGFNYQKSVILLLAVLHYLDNDFEVYVETDDDIVVSNAAGKTYMQAKSKRMSLAELLKQEKGKLSILEKNLSNGLEVRIGTR